MSKPNLEYLARSCVQAVVCELRRFFLYDTCLPCHIKTREDDAFRACEIAVEAIFKQAFRKENDTMAYDPQKDRVVIPERLVYSGPLNELYIGIFAYGDTGEAKIGIVRRTLEGEPMKLGRLTITEAEAVGRALDNLLHAYQSATIESQESHDAR